MRNFFSLVCLVTLLAVAVPAQAQLREQVRTQQAPARLYDDAQPGLTLNQLFSPSVFRMSHSFEMSAGSFGGQTSSLAMYTNSLRWQFSDQLAARMDIAMAYSPFQNSVGNQFSSTGNNGRVFLRNAELAYRPSENVQFHLSVRQSPYGRYMNPFGYYGPGTSSFMTAEPGGNLFWKEGAN